MADDILSALPKIVIAMGAGYFIGKFLSATIRKEADGAMALVETEPTETNMLVQSILMRPAVNQELNYLYGGAPPVTISNLTNMIVGTPIPYGM
tara:strand:+ start:582 stop:863 length:282 start_codon:yes stop_codon:yes gene_type:complete